MPRPKTSLEPDKINFRESFASLKFVPRFFNEIRRVNPLLFYATITSRIINAIIPVIMLLVGKLLIDEVVLQIAAEEKDLERLWWLIAAEFALAILSDLISRGISLSDALLGDQYSIDTSVKIIRKTSELNLESTPKSPSGIKLRQFYLGKKV